MTSFLGADTTALRTLGASMTALSGEVERVSAATSTALDQLAWAGNDRTGFHGEWTTGFAPALRTLASGVQDAATAVGAQADDQDRASSSTGAGSGAAGGAAAPAAGAAGPPLGSLSRQYESNGNPGTVSPGRGDHGGVSYGTYQLASRNGSAAAFVRSLKQTHPDYYTALHGSTPGTAAFSTAWRQVAADDPTGFASAQHDYIQATHYAPAVRAVERALPGIDLADRSPVVRDVLWSTAVQHGAGNTIFTHAVGDRDVTTMSDADLVRAVYAERGRDDGMAHFRSSSPGFRAGVVDRFGREERAALARLGGQ